MKLNMNSNFDLSWNSSGQSVSKSQITKATDKGICQQITNHKSYGTKEIPRNSKNGKFHETVKRLFLGGEEKVFSEKATLGKVKFFFFEKERKSRIESQYFDT